MKTDYVSEITDQTFKPRIYCNEQYGRCTFLSYNYVGLCYQKHTYYLGPIK